MSTDSMRSRSYWRVSQRDVKSCFVRQSKLRTLCRVTRLPSTEPVVICATSSAQIRSFEGAIRRQVIKRAPNAGANASEPTAARPFHNSTSTAVLKADHTSTQNHFPALPPGAWNHSTNPPQIAQHPSASVAEEAAASRAISAALMVATLIRGVHGGERLGQIR